MPGRQRRAGPCPAGLAGLASLLVALSGCGQDPAGSPRQVPDTTPTFPITGAAVPGMESFDRITRDLMRKHGIPGGAVAVAREGRLVYARGFGYADVDARTTVAPDALFRVASLAKPVTAAAVLRLVEQERFGLDAAAFQLLPDLYPPQGHTVDPRIARITIRHLLEHSGGWDRDLGFDPMFRSTTAAQTVGAAAPASAETVIRYMLRFPLEFEPGARYAYSNFGYAVLGRIIERASGSTYADYVASEVLAPAGIRRMRLARTRAEDRAPGEVKYYAPGGTQMASAVSVFPGDSPKPWPYGGFYIEAMDAHGGWLASTVDLLRFALSVDGRPSPADVLRPTSTQAMTARPPFWSGSAFWYGFGWLVRPSGGDANWWHDGSLPGTTALLVRSYHGLTWAALFNARTEGSGGFGAELDQAMWQAVAGVTAWPAHDLFGQF